MQLNLDQPTFKRLVQLYLATVMVAYGLQVWDAFDPTQQAFSEAFERLVETRFGQSGQDWQARAYYYGLLGMVWHLASAIGLFWYKRWARFGFWASLLLVLLLESIAFSFRPIFQMGWAGLFTSAITALFGAIVLIAYSSDHGHIWFCGYKLKENS